MRISRSRNVVENDDTPDTPTKLFVEQELVCFNKNCANHGKIVKTIRNEVPIG